MNIIELFLHLYITLFLIRFLVPNTGQMYFNKPYQTGLKLTDPVCRLFSSLRLQGKADFAALMSFFLLLLIKSLLRFDQGNVLVLSGVGGFVPVRQITVVYTSISFVTCLHYSMITYLKFLFQFCLFLFFLVWASYTQRVSDHMLLIFHNFLSVVLSRIYPRKHKFNLYEKPVPCFFTLLAFFSFLFFLFFLAGNSMRFLELTPEGFAALSLWTVLVCLQMALNVVALILPMFILRAVLSWIMPSSRLPLKQVIVALTDPFLAPFQKLSFRSGPFDLSPVLAFITCFVVLGIVAGILNNLISFF